MPATATVIFVLYNDGIYLNVKVPSCLHNFISASCYNRDYLICVKVNAFRFLQSHIATCSVIRPAAIFTISVVVFEARG